MEKVGVMCFIMGVLLFVLTKFEPAEAVSACFYTMKNCQGFGTSCPNLSEGLCCGTGKYWASVDFMYTSSCYKTYAYQGTRCRDPGWNDNGGHCFTNQASFISAKWESKCMASTLLTDVEQQEKPCTGFVEPSALIYSEDSSRGTWVLHHPAALDVVDQLSALPDADILAWLQAHGASYESVSDDGVVGAVATN